MIYKNEKYVLKNLANSLILKETITTTETKAKEVRSFVEKLVTLAKDNSLHARRELLSRLGSENSVNKLLEVMGPIFKERKGGYIRLIKLGLRKGNSARAVKVEFTQDLSAKSKVKEESEKELVGVELEKNDAKNTSNKAHTNKKRVASR